MTPIWSKDEQLLIDLLLAKGPKTLEEIAASLSGGFGRAVLVVGHLRREGKVAILANGRVALSVKRTSQEKNRSR